MKIIKIGPVTMGFRKREQPIQEWAEFDEALRRTIEATGFYGLLERGEAFLASHPRLYRLIMRLP